MNSFISRFSKRYSYSTILLKQMVVTDFKLRYQGSALGYFWSLLKPLTLFSVLYVVFVRFVRFQHPLPHNAIALLLGVVLWTFFLEVTMQGLGSIVGRGDLLRKLNFPRYVIVVSTAFSAFINLILNLCVVVIFMAFAHVGISADILWAPLLILELFAFALAVAFFLSALYVKFRDISYIWEVITQALFYATPIIYPLGLVPVHYAKLLLLNPIAQIIQDMRYVMITNQTPTIETLYHNGYVRLIPIGFTILVIVIAGLYFRSRSKYFAEEI